MTNGIRTPVIDSNNPHAVFPAGRKPGVLPRKSRLGEWCPRASEHIKLIPRGEWEERAADISLRPHVHTVLDQGSVGSCFPAGTMIRMADGSEKAIDKMVVLDRVLTAEGNVSTVTQVMVRKHDQGVVRLLINGSHHVICTAEHPILTERGYVAAGNLTKGDFVAFPRYAPASTTFIQTLDYAWSLRHTGSRRRMKSKAGSVCYRTIPGKSAARFAVHQLPDVIHLTRGFGRIIGLFLAEGCTAYGKVTFTFASHEKDTLASELVDLFRAELGVDAAMQVRGNSTVKVNVHGVHWSRLFCELCGKLSGGKRLHPDLASGTVEFLEGVLSGWTDGDGIGPDRFGGTSVSHSLALAMFDIANAAGKKPTIRVKRNPKLSHGVKSRQDVWSVEWGEGTLVCKADYRKHQDDTHLWRHVEGIEALPFDGYVFNLEVEGDHSYVAEGIGVHNCATESTAGGIMVARSMQGLPHVLLNPWFIYQETSGGRDQGSNIDSNLAFARQYGCASEAVWPRSKGWRAKPSEEAYADALKYRIEEFYDISTVDEFVSAVLTGFPVIYGAAGHSVLRVEYKLDLNSWGTGWKDGGFGLWASLNAINWGYGAFAIRVAAQG